MGAEKKKKETRSFDLAGLLKGLLVLILTASVIFGVLVAISAFGENGGFVIPEISIPSLGHMIPRVPDKDSSPEDPSAPRKAGERQEKSEEPSPVDESFNNLLEKKKELAEKELRRQEIAKEFPLFAAAYPEFDLRYLHARIYDRAGANAKVIGYLRRGTVVRAKEAVSTSNCGGGDWHPIEGGGYICSGFGYEVKETPPKLDHEQRKPDTSKTVPFDYFVPTENGKPLLRRLPTLEELPTVERAREKKAQWPKNMLARRMVGFFRLSGDRKYKVGQKTYLRTILGNFVDWEDIEPVDEPEMKGVFLDEMSRLPMAFVFEKARKTYVMEGDELVERGELPKHARFHVESIFKKGKKAYVTAPNGIIIPREHVRIAEKIPPLKRISGDEKWIHIDLGQQALVAYEGKKPVFATLVSSGMKGYSTPRGTFAVDKKYVTTTMSGDDPVEGHYRVEDVPWTLFYWGSYALHGAYWHNDFGIARSHGCTNVSPFDAKWLYDWSEPAVPDRWHARIRAKGTVIHYSR